MLEHLYGNHSVILTIELFLRQIERVYVAFTDDDSAAFSQYEGHVMQVVLHRAIACQYYSIRDVSTEARFVHDKLSSCVAAVAPLTCVHIDVFVAPLRSAAKDKNFLGVAV